MEPLNEDKNCYRSLTQREVLLQLISNPVIEKSFFLTGGTALSVFYLHHRVSEDLDFFTLNSPDLGDIGFWIKTQWPGETTIVKEGSQFLSLLIRDVKVDFVIDPVSVQEERPGFTFENGKTLHVDTVNNIVSNKLCTLVSRTEPKDFVDFYMILKMFSTAKLEDIYKGARLKEALFDDPPTAAFQLEAGLAFLKENPGILPQMQRQFDPVDFQKFYDEVIRWIYSLIKPGR